MIAKIAIKHVRKDIPICPCHGPKHREPMRQYSRKGRTIYFACRQVGCDFRAKTIVVIV